jgi:hypothetical protein
MKLPSGSHGSGLAIGNSERDPRTVIGRLLEATYTTSISILPETCLQKPLALSTRSIKVRDAILRDQIELDVRRDKPGNPRGELRSGHVEVWRTLKPWASINRASTLSR